MTEHTGAAKAFRVRECGYLAGRDWWRPNHHRASHLIQGNLPNTPYNFTIIDHGSIYVLYFQCAKSRKEERASLPAKSKKRKSKSLGMIELSRSTSPGFLSRQAIPLLVEYLKANPEYDTMPRPDDTAKLDITHGQLFALLDTAGVARDSASVMATSFVPKAIKPVEELNGDGVDTHSVEFLASSFKVGIDRMLRDISVTYPETVTPLAIRDMLDTFLQLGKYLGVPPNSIIPTETIEQLAMALSLAKLDARAGLFTLGFDPDQSEVLADYAEGDDDAARDLEARTEIRYEMLHGPRPEGN